MSTQRIASAASPDAVRFSELDGLRGLAAAAVMIYHLSGRSRYEGEPPLFFSMPWGAYGVQLFFMISGFVILMSARRAKRPRDFFVSRVSRLYPPYWIAVSVTALLAFGVGVPTYHGDLNCWGIVANYTMLQRWMGVPNVDEVYWTLGVELQFYVLMFVLLVLTRCRLQAKLLLWLALAWTVCALAVACWAAPASHNVNPIHVPALEKVVLSATITPYGPLFCVGMLAYLARNGELARWPAVVTGFVAGLQYGLVQSWMDGLVVSGLFVVFLIVAWRPSTPLLRRPPIKWLGMRSYSLYIGHLAVGTLTIHLLWPYIGRTAATAAAVVLVLAWASILYRIGELHGTRQMKRMLTRAVTASTPDGPQVRGEHA